MSSTTGDVSCGSGNATVPLFVYELRHHQENVEMQGGALP